jgi:hypothetical protein
MRGYEDSPEDFYGEEVPDQIESQSVFSRRIIGILLIALGLVGTTVAANISLSNGRIEMGQGVYRITACDQWIGIGLYPTAAIYGGKSRVQTVELVGLDPRMCKNVIFRIKMFKNTDLNSPLALFVGTATTDTTTATATEGNVTQLSVYDTATVSYPTTTYDNYARRALSLVNQANVNVGYNDGYHSISYVAATGVYRINLVQPLALMEDIDKITIESASLTN